MLELIRGDTLSYIVAVPEAHADSTVRSQIRDFTGKLWANLLCEWEEPSSPGTKFLSVRALDGTDKWPLGTLYMDMRFMLSEGTVEHTRTLPISVLPSITR